MFSDGRNPQIENTEENGGQCAAHYDMNYDMNGCLAGDPVRTLALKSEKEFQAEKTGVYALSLCTPHP